MTIEKESRFRFQEDGQMTTNAKYDDVYQKVISHKCFSVFFLQNKVKTMGKVLWRISEEEAPSVIEEKILKWLAFA